MTWTSRSRVESVLRASLRPRHEVQVLRCQGEVRLWVSRVHGRSASRSAASRSGVSAGVGGSARGRVEAALAAPVGVESAVVLAGIDPVDLDAAGLLARVRLADRVAGWAAALASAALADFTGPEPSPVSVADAARCDAAERELRLEVRVARGCSDQGAARDIDTARRLGAQLRPARDAWAAGVLTWRHVWVLSERTRGVAPDTAAAVVAHLSPGWSGVSSNRFGARVTAALCRIDPQGEAARARVARRHDLGIRFRSLGQGLGEIIATHRVEDARALMDHLDTTADRLLAHRRTCEPCAQELPDEIGPARAAAHLHAILGTPTDPTTDTTTDPDAAGTSAGGRTRRGSRRGSRRSRRGELQVVIDLATLAGLAEHPGLVGGEPIPADLARELASSCGSLRRIITDPLTGHLLDYGTRTYLPDPLRRFITARDATCTAPGCTQPATRSQLDHITPWPAGPSDPTNTHMACKNDHDHKTHGAWTITTHHPDGTSRWRTRLGQTGTTEPRPYLPAPPPATPEAPPPEDHPPPF